MSIYLCRHANYDLLQAPRLTRDCSSAFVQGQQKQLASTGSSGVFQQTHEAITTLRKIVCAFKLQKTKGQTVLLFVVLETSNIIL